jgi:glyoxylase-like metal-dependent hydrolase (beta-lactamase superfamily II)
VKLVTQINAQGETFSVIVLNDAGVGSNTTSNLPGVPDWNINTYITRHVNPTRIPYLVLLSHCHYDHTLGLKYLLDDGNHVSILSSSHNKSFVTPYAALQENSLCNSMHLDAPVYKPDWAGDSEELVYSHPSGYQMHLPIITLHTPGHTPDSLSWYDTEERTLYVGDSFYAQTSADTSSAPWGSESPAPILFPREGDLVAWWSSLGKLISFVNKKNRNEAERVKLSASHVTVSMDAATFLEYVEAFMLKVLRDEIPVEEVPAKRGERFGYWTEDGGVFRLGAPLRIVEDGRARIT